MKLICPIVIVTVTTVLSFAFPTLAGAQASSAGPAVNEWYAGVSTGAAIVDAAGGMFNAEAGMRLRPNLDVVGELGWFQDTTTSHRAGLTKPLTDYLEAAFGQPASANVDTPSFHGSINVRWVFESERRWRPYGLFGLGAARVSPNTTFTSGGTDITGSLPSYGITLGNDLSGHSSHLLVNVGVGVLIPFGRWYADAGYRLSSIQTKGQASNVNRINIGAGARF